MRMSPITIVSICAAVIAASVSAVMVSMNRADAARAFADAETAAADSETAQAKIKTAERDVENAKRRTAEAEAKAKADELEAQKLAKEKAEIDAKIAADNRAEAEAEAKIATEKADAQRALREAEKAKVDVARSEEAKAKALAKAEASKVVSETARLETEKLRSQYAIAEVQLLELRRTNYLALAVEYAQLNDELKELKKAFEPEKTITDLEFAEEEKTFDANGNVTNAVKVVYNPEKDMSLPESTRRLAKAMRIDREMETNRVAMVRESIVKPLEALYEQALRDGRVIDAQYYRSNILSMYPDWKFKANAADEKTEVEKKDK